MSRPTWMTMMSHCPSGLPTKRGPSCDTAAHVVGFWSEETPCVGPHAVFFAKAHNVHPDPAVWGTCVHCTVMHRNRV